MKYVLLERALGDAIRHASPMVLPTYDQALERATTLATQSRWPILIARIETIVDVTLSTEVKAYGPD